MGLASKLAASQQGGSPYGQATQGGYGSAPPAGYGAPSASGQPQPKRQVPGVDEAAIKQRLTHIIHVNNLHAFYPEARVTTLAREIMQSDIVGLADRWRLTPKLLLDLVALALYDIVIMADDSGSMKAAENGTRIDDLRAILERITDAVTLFDTDGISVKFMNQDISGNNIRSAQDVIRFVDQARYGGLTPLGTQLNRKIMYPFVLAPANARTLNKPVSVIVITDGEPSGEPDGTVKKLIQDTKKALGKSIYGEKAAAFQFVQVGKDEDARKFLGKLDNDSKIGGMVDSTQYFEIEQEEYRKANPNQELTPEMYLVKLLLGAIDPEYDLQDGAVKKKSLFGGLFGSK